MREPIRALLQPVFSAWGSPVTGLEIVAFALSVWMVLANLRVHPIAWPLAIASSLLYALLFADSRLYGEASLQVFFAVLSVWGWWRWLRPASSPAARAVGWMSGRERLLAVAATLAAWPALGLLLSRVTDSDVPYFDALPTAASIVGQVLLGLKRVENWPTWIGVNLVSIGLFAYKGLWLTVLLYAIFCVLSVIGWRAWQRLAAGG